MNASNKCPPAVPHQFHRNLSYSSHTRSQTDTKTKQQNEIHPNESQPHSCNPNTNINASIGGGLDSHSVCYNFFSFLSFCTNETIANETHSGNRQTVFLHNNNLAARPNER